MGEGRVDARDAEGQPAAVAREVGDGALVGEAPEGIECIPGKS